MTTDPASNPQPASRRQPADSAQSAGTPVRGPESAQDRAPVADPGPVLPDRGDQDSDEAWGERSDGGATDRQLWEDRPPHYGGG